jgi:predicted unusual protein kinase regulating ubiquinone biosynthesis (AarF/ABC1/UbiB family)
MSALSEIGRAKFRMLQRTQAKPQTQNTAATAPERPARMTLALRLRAVQALWFGARMIGGFIWWELILARAIGQERVGRGRMQRFVMLARRFRALAIALGGVWIKLGQFLSSRVDILPPEVIVELQDLQDAVPAEPSDRMLRTIETELGAPIAQLFEEFDPLPIAAASFGQAYMAVLRPESSQQKTENGGRLTEGGASDSVLSPPSSVLRKPASASARRVIVKVQRSGLNGIVRTDLRSLKTIAGWLNNYRPIKKRANVDALVEEFAAGVYAELDYEQEARNAEAFDRHFAADTAVRVPKVYAELSTRRVIVLKNVEDIKITDYAGLDAAGVSRKQVARKLFETYLKQVFTDGFYHADPHPGNLFVQPLDVATARAWRVPVNEGTPFRVTYVDFGMMGRVQPAMVKELKEFIIAISLRDARRWTLAAQRLGFILPGADLVRIEQAVGTLFDKFWGMGMNDIANVEFGEMYQFSLQFKDLLSSLPFQVPQNVLYLGRAANILSGMMVALDPGFNPWQALLPFANDLTGGVGASPAKPAQDILAELLKVARLTVQLPNQADAFFSRALNGQMEFRAQLNSASTEDLRRIETSVTRLTWAIVFIALLICGTLLLLNAFTGLGIAALVLGALAFLRVATLG